MLRLAFPRGLAANLHRIEAAAQTTISLLHLPSPTACLQRNPTDSVSPARTRLCTTPARRTTSPSKRTIRFRVRVVVAVHLYREETRKFQLLRQLGAKKLRDWTSRRGGPGIPCRLQIPLGSGGLLLLLLLLLIRKRICACAQ